ncbi:MAG: class I SAM-dependent methyltransferase [Spirochaetales bacterium]
MNFHVRLFERIALPYSWFFARQTRTYASCFEQGRYALPDPKGKRALDIGCGSGAFTQALKNEGWDTDGVDAAPAMVAQAGKLGVSCRYGNVLNGLPFPEKSYDLVSAAYVAHGLSAEERRLLFKETRRLSRSVVLFHDYNSVRRLTTDIAEYLEDGDYFNFIHTAVEEMNSAFSKVTIVPVGRQSAWYVCAP